MVESRIFMAKVLAINARNTSLQFEVIEMPAEIALAAGKIEQANTPEAVLTITTPAGKQRTFRHGLTDVSATVNTVLVDLAKMDVLADPDDVTGVGHRVVAGGEEFSAPTRVDERVIDDVRGLSEYAPLHNPIEADYMGAFMHRLPKTPMVAVFDTAFHQTMPPVNFLYSIPISYYKKFGARRYGAHGTSHDFAAHEAAKYLGIPLEDLRMISIHLGVGSSATAVQAGHSLDTSMGFTPLAGLTMGTRSGDIDPSLVAYLAKKTDKTFDQMIKILNDHSGMLGLTGFSQDFREIDKAASLGNERAAMAEQIFVNSVVRYIGAYTAEMHGLDVIVFTGSVGEHIGYIRHRILDRVAFMGIAENPAKMAIQGTGMLTMPESKIKAMVVTTNEEVMIARDVMAIVAHRAKN
jgi:acetate kinase